MAGGVTAYAVLCSIVLLAYCVWMLRKYAHAENTPLHVYASVLISWLFSLILVYLLPLDLIPRFENHKILLPFYQTIYWISFTFMWIVIPLQQGYVLSGYFSFKGKILDSLLQNIYFFAVVGVLFVIGLVYIAVTAHIAASNLATLAIALSNVYGLSLGILTLGYGLVEIPRNLWYASDASKNVVYLHFLAAQVGNDREEARDRLDEILFLFYSARDKADNASRYLTEFAQMENLIPSSERARAADIMNGRVTRPVAENESLREAILDKDEGFTPKVCATLNYELKWWLFEAERSNKHFVKVMVEILTLEGILKETDRYENNTLSPRSGVYEKLQFYFTVNVKPIATKMMAVILAICSCLIIWSELALTFKDSQNLSPFALLVEHARSSTTGADSIIVFGLFLFSYMTWCALYALFRLRLMKYYHMHSYHCTDANSLLFNAAYTQRLMFSLGYNFLLICLGNQHVSKSPFINLFANMGSVVPLLDAPVNKFLPLLVVIFVGATLFNVYGWLLKCLRISRFEFSNPNRSEEVRSQIREGEMLARKFKRDLESNPTLMDELGIDENHFASRSFGTLRGERARRSDVPMDDLGRADSPQGSVGYDMRNISIDT